VKVLEKCKFNLKENLQTRSVYCGKLQQWISIKYYALCLDHEAAAPETKTTKENFSFYLYYVTSYLASYLTSEPKPKTKTHQNSFTKPSFPSKIFVLCVGGGGSG
jgi:hypothetical protein